MSSDPRFDNPDRTDLGPEAPADTETLPRINDSVEANEADVLEQSIEATDDDELRQE